MTERHRFLAASTATVVATRGNVWALWADVNGWTSWNTGIKASRLHGNFKQGSTFDLTLQGGLTAVGTIVEVSQGEGFTDETPTPFGVVRNDHRMAVFGDLVIVTHRVAADIDTAVAAEFGTGIWPGMQTGLYDSLAELVDLAGD
ncbi:polyketide cyclase [Nocardia terpenica]|uniref:Polyketide cyclase n=1 Tax=Nocardia terpenica TaxID=455432 RepID=A0A164PDU4_9NOCA|nr:hypothetical protein [Nocardia terpenica]KZM75437.1 hypothetical protein AWN90_18825 [Nocardia terpenica]MBF6066097.1 polyketide cyclase [Nocardia terpenica]MBF6109212.1 polyketide cyclase [Nocardia terpenica]MBF6116341.1 polyketide cyclase [Nocardia terpenica]MBF6123498.1 polyketide cyclase [Nocardia terpenica]